MPSPVDRRRAPRRGETPGAGLVAHHPPATQHQQLVGDGGRRFQVVGHEDDDAAGGALGGELGLQPGGAGRIQRRRRLVEEEQRGVVGQRPRERQALQHAAREGPRRGIGGNVAEAHAGEQRRDPRGRRVGAVEAGEQAQVLARRSARRRARDRGRRSRCARAAADPRKSGSAPQRTAPLDGATSVERIPSSVDFPAPFGPRIAATRPGSKRRADATPARGDRRRACRRRRGRGQPPTPASSRALVVERGQIAVDALEPGDQLLAFAVARRRRLAGALAPVSSVRHQLGEQRLAEVGEPRRSSFLAAERPARSRGRRPNTHRARHEQQGQHPGDGAARSIRSRGGRGA